MGILPDITQAPAHLKSPVMSDTEKYTIYRKAAARQRKLYQALQGVNVESF